MKSSEILREAARLVCERKRGFACHAIWDVCGTPTTIAAFELLRPTYSERCFVNYPDGVEFPSDDNLVTRGDFWWFDHMDHAREYRLFGLCLAAAIAESEGD